MMDFLKKILYNHYKVKHKHCAEFVSWSDIHTILLLLDYQDLSMSDIRPIVTYLSNEGKQVEVYYYVGKQEEKEQTISGVHLVSEKKVNFWGMPKPNIFSEGKKFDIIIDLTFHKRVPLYYIISGSLSKMTCGSIIPNDDKFFVYDFAISLNGKVEETKPIFLLEQIVKYLKMIKSK